LFMSITFTRMKGIVLKRQETLVTFIKKQKHSLENMLSIIKKHSDQVTKEYL